jgi:tetratricopeptide (TPR) repeat protein
MNQPFDEVRDRSGLRAGSPEDRISKIRVGVSPVGGHLVAFERMPRRASPRQNLYAATMLVPLVATFALAGGKVAMRSTHFGGFVEAAQAQQASPAQRTVPRAGGQPSAVPAQTQPAASPPVSAAPTAAASTGAGSAAVAVLLEQANYWRNQQQYDQAIESLKRALALEPRNADALALTGMIEADRGNRSVAENALTRLRATAPGDPRIDKIDQALRVGAIPQEALTDARKLAANGRQAEAVDRYNRVFRGNPPPDRLSVEYYQTLAGTEGGWEQARDGLARVVRQNPQDLRAQLAYAQILTYREGAREDGIARLAALAKNPTVSEQATTAWRQALGWLPDNPTAVDPINNYLTVHPNDAQLANKLEAARSPAVNAADPTAQDRIGGFDALNKNRLGDAAKLFQKAIDTNPNDADAIGGLGLVKLRQRNFAEAKSLLGRAIALDPEHRGRWEPALTGADKATSAAARGGGGGNASAAAQAMLNRGEFAAAEAELKRQIARNVDNSGGLQSMLADAQAQQGKLGEAEASYRESLALNSRSAGALVGLAGVLSREGRSQEAQTLLAQAESMGAGPQVGQARALALRQQAQDLRDPNTQAALYREAVAADPNNPWLRLDLARSLVKIGQVAQARAVMAQVVAGGHPTTDQIKAGIIFANETSDPDAASELINMLPPSARTADMRVLQNQAALQREIGSALLLSRPVAKQRLLEMAAEPDPDGARGAAIARALNKIGEKTAARDALLVARGASGGTPSARLAYAGAFLDIGDVQDAEATLRRLGSGNGLTPQQKNDFSQLEAGLAVRSSDNFNQQGKQAAGYDALAPQLARSPNNPALNMALARLYEGAKKPSQALEINEALLRRDPDNQDARRAAIDAAIAAGNRSRADELVQEGLRMHPNDPKAWIASAELNKARGNNARALQDYEHARDLRLQQLGYSESSDDTSVVGSVTPAGVSLVPGAPATYAPVTAPRSQYYSPGPVPLGNPDGGADDSTVPPADAPLSAPPNLYPDNVKPSSPRAPLTQAPVTAPNYDIRRGRMLDTTANDLPPPRGSAITAVSASGGSATPVSATYVPNPPPAVTTRTPSSAVPSTATSTSAATADSTVESTSPANAPAPAPMPAVSPSLPAPQTPTPVQPSPTTQAAAPPPSSNPVPLAPPPVIPVSAPPPAPPVAPQPTVAQSAVPPSAVAPPVWVPSTATTPAVSQTVTATVPAVATSTSQLPAATPTYSPAQYQAPVTPPPSVSYQPAQYQPAPPRPAQYQTVQYQPAAPAYQAPQYAAPAYQPPSYAAPQYAAPQYAAPQYAAPQYAAPTYQPPSYAAPQQAPTYGAPVPGGYRNVYQPTVPPDAQYQPQLRGYLPQYQPAPVPVQAPPPPRIVSPPSSLQAGPFGRVPSVLSDQGNDNTGYYNNPFRRGPSATTSDTGGAPAGTPGGADAVTEEIDRNIVSLRDEVAPSLQAGVGYRSRSGDSGLDKLQEFTVPIEAEFSPGGTGRAKLTVTPVQLDSGAIVGDVTNYARFGTSAFALVPGSSANNFMTQYNGTKPPTQNQQGIGLGASYVYGNFKGDVGTSPLGFKLMNIVGGAEWAPKLTDNLTLRLLGEQRSITDSILSYAGTVDTRTGIKWGGEVRDRAHANFEFSAGKADFYIGGGLGNVRGTHVPSNAEIEFGAGGSYPIYREGGQELRVGLDLVYFGYNKNLGYFTLGQGGYFSPQSYSAALIPVIWREKVDEDLNYEVGASLGFQTYNEKTSSYYPEDPQLQAELVTQQAGTKTAIPGLLTSYPAQSKSGFAGNAHGMIDYRVAPNLHIGGKLNYQHSGNFDEASGVVYARYLFNGTHSE